MTERRHSGLTGCTASAVVGEEEGKNDLALRGMRGQANLGQNPLKGLIVWRCALKCKARGKAVGVGAHTHLLILMELSEPICRHQGLVLNISPRGR